ncbi:DUF4192 family protein [Dactylosporangium cerinum]
MNSTPGTLRLRSTEDLLTAIPYLIGYHPTDSVVCLAVRDAGTPVIVSAALPPSTWTTSTPPRRPSRRTSPPCSPLRRAVPTSSATAGRHRSAW